LKKLSRYDVKSDVRASPHQIQQGTTTGIHENVEHVAKVPPPNPRVNGLPEIAKM